MTQYAFQEVRRVELNVAAVAAPVHHVARVSSEVVRHSLRLFRSSDLRDPVPKMGEAPAHLLTGPPQSLEERRLEFGSWILSKGFQELVRGVRQSLEEAANYLGIAARAEIIKSDSQLYDERARIQKKAQKGSFGDLLAQVNKGLASPLKFNNEFTSLQRVRNCLEHRAGIVGEEDFDSGRKFISLSVPSVECLVEREDGSKATVALGDALPVTPGEKLKVVNSLTTSTIRYEEGQRIQFSEREFEMVAFACFLFGSDLASRLPQPIFIRYPPQR